MELTPLQKVVQTIEQHTGPSKIRGSQHEVRCPAHPDNKPSLGITENSDGHVLMYCQAGCATADILAAVGLAMRDLYPIRTSDRRTDPVIATYRYVDETGQLLYEVLRTVAKRFTQRRPDPDKPGGWLYNLDGVRRVLYRLPSVAQAITEGQVIYLVEGEKDVHTVEGCGQVATCNPGGAGKWRQEYAEALRGAHVVVVTDIDPSMVGLRHARQVAASLAPLAASVTLVQPAAGKDTTDHITAGLELDAMQLVGPEMPVGPSAPLGGAPRPPDDTLENIPTSPAEPPVDDRRARIRVTPLSSFKIKAVRWVWDQRMPLGELCLIAGREGIGKSTFLAWLAAAITNGNLPGIYHGEPRGVLYSATEDAYSYTIAPRMQAAGANLDLVYRIDVLEDEGPAGLILPRDSRYLPEIAEETKAAVLMCDPILSLVDDRINPNHGKELRRALEPLKHAAEAAGLAIPALVHFNKTRDVDVLSMMAGSRAWTEVARSALAIAQDRDADEYTCVVSQVKNNLGRLDQPNLTYTMDDVVLETEDDGPDAHIGRIRWTGETETGAGEILARRPTTGPRDDRTATHAAVLDWLDEHGQAASPRQVADGLAGTVNYENAKKILSRLAASGEVDKIGTGLYKTPDGPTSHARKNTHGPTPQPRRAGQRPSRDAHENPTVVPSPFPSQTKIYGGGLGGTNGVPGGETPQGQQGRDVGAYLSSSLTSCSVCFGPLDDVEGTGVHPTCVPEDNS